MATDRTSGDGVDDHLRGSSDSEKNINWPVEANPHHSREVMGLKTSQQEVQQATQQSNAYEISGGEFQGAFFGPQHYRFKRQDGIFGGNFEGAHIGPKCVQKIVHNTYITKYEDAALDSDSAGPSTGPKKRKLETSDHTDKAQLSDSIQMFVRRPLSKQGNVYEGVQTSAVYGSRPLAVKFLKYSEQNAQEARTLLKLAHHPNVVSIIHSDVYHKGPFPHIYIAMELCHPQNLHEYVIANRNATFDSHERISQAKQLVSGLSFIHENHVIHRDLKPHNILLSEDKKCLKIGDFGLSKELRRGRSVVTQSMARVGTDGFRAPETYNSDVISQQADVFSLGLVLYFLWSNGCHVYGNDPDDWNRNIKRNDNKDLSRLLLTDPEPAKSLIERMLRFEPRQRPTAQQVMDDVFLGGTSSAAMHGPASDSRPTSRQAHTRQADNAIVVFDKKSKSLLSFKPSTRTWDTMQPLSDDMVTKKLFTAIALACRVYVIMSNKAVYQLNCTGSESTWSRIPDMLEDHGWHPPVTTLQGDICVVGASGGFGTSTTTVEAYDFKMRKWTRLQSMKREKRNHAVVTSNDCIYCIGGWDERYHVLASVEKYDHKTGIWCDACPMKRALRSAAAVPFRSMLYVIGGHDGLCSLRQVESYDTLNNLWTTVTRMQHPRCHFRVCVVDDGIFAVGGDENRTIEVFDAEKQEWEVVETMKNIKIYRMASISLKI